MHPIRLGACAAGVTFAIAAVCQAATNANPVVHAAAPIVVTAGRLRQDASELPAAVTVISAEQIASQGSQNVVDALRDLAGVYVRNLNGNAAQAEVVLRGFGENAHGRVLVLCNGQRLNTPDMAGINWLQVPLGSVERIEILRGGQSVLYGDHALAGVINIVTAEGAGKTSPTLSLLAGSYGAFAARAAYAATDDATRVAASADWQTGDGFRHNGDFDVLGLRAGVNQEWSDTLRSSLALAYDRYENGLPGYLSLEQMAADPRQTLTPDDYAKSRNLNANLGLGWTDGADSRIEGNLIVNRKEIDSLLPSWMSYVDSTIDSLAFTPRYVLEGDLMGRRNRLLTGLDFYLDRLDATRYTDASFNTRLLDATLDKQSAGAYLQDELRLNPQWAVTVGGRAEAARYDATVTDAALGRIVDDRKTHPVNACETSLRYEPTTAVKLFARAATVYRLPFVDEQVSYFGYGMDRFYADLDPETGRSFDLGGTMNFGGGWQGEVTLFQLDMQDEIAYNPLTGANENLDDTRRQGVESALSWARADTGAATLRYTFTDARFTAGTHDGNDVPLVPQHRVTLNGQADLFAGLALLATLHVVGDQALGGDTDNLAARLDNYLTLDLGLRYTPPKHPGFSLFCGLDNVFDESYANVAYMGMLETGYYPAPGRAWKTALSCAF